MASNQSNNAKSLRSVFEKDKLNGTNFMDWYRNLRIVLKQEKTSYVLDAPVPEEPPATASRLDRDAFKRHKDDANDVACLMLATMSSELQKQHEQMQAYNMIEHLKMLFEEQARQERYETTKALFQCKMAEGSPVGPHVLKMIGYIERLENMGFPMVKEIFVDAIL